MGGIETDTFLLVGMIMAIGAGALSFLSPCVLPIFPAYLSYITGVSVKELQGNQTSKIRKQLLSHSFFFLAGVSLVFIALGASASFLGQWAQQLLVGESGLLIQRIAGVFIIFMGFFVAGWINIPTLMREKRMHFSKDQQGFWERFLLVLVSQPDGRHVLDQFSDQFYCLRQVIQDKAYFIRSCMYLVSSFHLLF